MDKKLYVMSGDVISSRRIKNKESFQERLEKICDSVNRDYSANLYAEYKILKGIDEIEGVLLNISKMYEIITSILEQLYPYSMRFAFVFDSIDTAIETHDASRMDGPAFHKVSDLIKNLKESKLIFAMSTGNDITDNLISGQINSILLLKKNWSANQRLIVRKYKETNNQNEVAKELGITQQAVSKALKRSMWKEIRYIEEQLNKVLESMNKTTGR